MEEALPTNLKPGVCLSLTQYFKSTFLDPTGQPDGNRITAFLSAGIVFIYAPLSLFRTKLGMDEMPGELLLGLLGLAGFTGYRSSRETVEQIRTNPDVLTRE